MYPGGEEHPPPTLQPDFWAMPVGIPSSLPVVSHPGHWEAPGQKMSGMCCTLEACNCQHKVSEVADAAGVRGEAQRM